MNNKKKQTVAVAMATALGVSAMMSPVAVHAQEEDPVTAITQEDNQQDSSQETKLQDETPVSEQGLPANEIPQALSTNGLLSATGTPIHPRSNGAFTNQTEAEQAIKTALDSYPVSNETTYVELLDFLNEEFVDTGKLKSIDVSLDLITKATPTATGSLTVRIDMEPVVASGYFPSRSNFVYTLRIPRLPQAGEVAIDKANFPDDTFRKYVSDNFDDDNDDVLSTVELDNATTIQLYGEENIKNIKGIQYLKNIDFISCGETQIKTIDVSENKKLESLFCSDIPTLTSLNVDGADALVQLQCYSTGITELNVSNNTNLEWLNCYMTSINSLDVSNNSKLRVLDCFSNPLLTSLKTNRKGALENLNISETGLSKLDISEHISLTKLNAMKCPNLVALNISNASSLKELWTVDSPALANIQTGNNIGLEKLIIYGDSSLQTIDLSSMSNLENFNGEDTALMGLDVTHNSKLDQLSLGRCPLAYLNLPLGGNISYLDYSNSSTLSLNISGSTFKITDVIPDINIDNLKLISGASRSGEIFSEYKNGEPIIYTYQCGVYKGKDIQMTVSLTPNIQKLNSSIIIKKDLNKPYDGIPMELDKSDINVQGSKGAVTFTYEKWNGSTWEAFHNLPTDAGRYNVQAHLAGDDYYNEAVSEKKEFTITQATNSWKNAPTISDWTYGGQTSTPTAIAHFGNSTFTYSDSKTGTFTADVPVNAGTWYVKAMVAGTDNYTSMESIHAFTISPKGIKDGNITVSDINNDNDVKKIIVKDGDKELLKGTDYDVVTKKDGNKTIVTIAFKGNYAGTIERTYTVETSQPEKPEQKPQQGKPQEKPKDTGSVKTGDITQTGLLATLSMLSAGCIALLAGKKRKKNMKEDETTPL